MRKTTGALTSLARWPVTGSDFVACPAVRLFFDQRTAGRTETHFTPWVTATSSTKLCSAAGEASWKF